MHEMGLAADLCAIIKERAEGRTVRKIMIELGAFSGVNSAAFRFCAETIFKQELGEQAAAEIHEIPAQLTCTCGKVYSSEDPLDGCPACGGHERTVTSGDDLLLKSIDVD